MKIAQVHTGEFGISLVEVVNHNYWKSELSAPGGMNPHSAFFFMLQHDVAWVVDEEISEEPMSLQEWYWEVEGGK